MSQATVICRGLSRTYQQESVPVHALQDVDFELFPGEFVSLSGPSGSGKSTLLNIIGGLDRPDAGTVEVAGNQLNDLNAGELSDLRLQKLGFVFQAYNLIPVLSAQENVEFVMQLQGVDAGVRADKARAMLAQLGLEGLESRRPGELSGGQQQRVAIARAVVNDPALLLADEPSANLDSKTTEDLLKMLQDLNRNNGITILTATHDPMVMQYASRHVKMRDGRIDSDDHGQAGDAA